MEFIYASLGDIPLYNQDNEIQMPETATRMKAIVTALQGVLFVTPEHNRSVPAALKNAIDWVRAPTAKMYGKASRAESWVPRPARPARPWRSSTSALSWPPKARQR